MFSTSVREPSPEDIQAARVKDERDFEAAQQAATTWMKGLEALVRNGATIGTMAPYHKSASDVMRLCAIADGPAERYRLEVRRIDDSIAAEIIKAMEKSSAADGAKVRDSDQKWMALRSIASHPLFAQLARKDGPISEDEQVPTILCDSVATVKEIVEIVSATQLQDAKSWHRQALASASRQLRYPRR